MKPDTRNLLRHLTFLRAVNYAKVKSSFMISRLLHRNLHWGMPVSVSIEPTTACNLACPECPSGLRKFSRPTGNLREDMYTRILDQLGRQTLYVNFYFQGEPTIHPRLFEMIRKAKSRKMYTATSTNAHFLDGENAQKLVESGLDRLVVSVDGITQETYAAYRVNGSLNKVLQGIENITKAKKALGSKTPHVIFQMLVVRHNEHEVPQAQKLADALGADEFCVKTAQVYDYKNGNDLIPEQEKFSRYKKKEDGTYMLKNRLSNDCWRMWQGCVFTWDGRVVPCCFDKDAEHQMGTIDDNRMFRDIWKGAPYRNFRKKILNSRKEIDICKNCTEGTQVFA